jgi:hypothetical protein
MEAEAMVALEKAREDEREAKFATEKAIAEQREKDEAVTKVAEEEKWGRDEESINNDTSLMDTNIPETS